MGFSQGRGWGVSYGRAYRTRDNASASLSFGLVFTNEAGTTEEAADTRDPSSLKSVRKTPVMRFFTEYR